MKLGYHKIRGLAAPARMMFHYKKRSFEDVCYGEDMMDVWFKVEKPELAKKNSLINLPYIIDGDLVVTQSNSVLLYLGQKLGIDQADHFIKNHMVLDEVMDLRNDLMTLVYPFAGQVKTKEEFPDAARKHLSNSVKTHLTKLEGFCVGPYMCGASPQSGDFHVFEMLDQHQSICKKLGEPDVLESYPKLKALHGAMKADENLQSYFGHDCYCKFAQNNGLFTHFTGHGDDFKYGETVRNTVTF